jgi:hypothetical protein
MKVRHLLCKAMIALKVGNLNCTSARLFRRAGGLTSEDLEELRRQESERKPVESIPVCSERNSRPTNRVHTLDDYQPESEHNRSENDLETLAKP